MSPTALLCVSNLKDPTQFGIASDSGSKSANFIHFMVSTQLTFVSIGSLHWLFNGYVVVGQMETGAGEKKFIL